MALVSNDNKLNGYRFFLDAAGTRQYAIKYENGKASKDIQVFDETGAKTSLRPNETVFAFEDGAALTAGAGGSLKILATAVEIKVNADSRPYFLASSPVEYETKFSFDGKNSAPSYRLSDNSAALLQEKKFSPGFPREMKNETPAGNEFDEQLTTGGLILLPSSSLSTSSFGISQPFPPQHVDGAKAARNAVAGNTDSGAPYEMADPQTLVERKKLGAGEVLRTLFNFEAARVTEVFTAPNTQPAATSHSFAEHDLQALETAREKLVKLGGKPNALKKVLSPSITG